MGARWTEAEDETLRRLYPTHGKSWDGWACNGGDLLPGRTREALHSRSVVRGCTRPDRRGRSWSVEDERTCVAHLAAACRSTGRSPLSVVRHLEWLVRKARSHAREV